MLFKVLPEEINKKWKYYAPFIANSLPPATVKSHRGMVNVLEAILLDRLVCWGYYNEGGDLIFLTTTKFDYDEVTKTRRLLIYTFTAVSKIDSIMFKKALTSLNKYAKSNGCTSIVAFTKNERVIEYLKRLDAKTEFRLIEMEVV